MQSTAELSKSKAMIRPKRFEFDLQSALESMISIEMLHLVRMKTNRRLYLIGPENDANKMINVINVVMLSSFSPVQLKEHIPWPITLDSVEPHNSAFWQR